MTKLVYNTSSFKQLVLVITIKKNNLFKIKLYRKFLFINDNINEMTFFYPIHNATVFLFSIMKKVLSIINNIYEIGTMFMLI